MSTLTMNVAAVATIDAANPGSSYSYTNPHTCYGSYNGGSAGTGTLPMAILRFNKPSALQYKKITKAILTLASYGKWEYGYANGNLDQGYIDLLFAYNAAIAPYKSDADLTEIKYNNYQTKGTLGDYMTVNETFWETRQTSALFAPFSKTKNIDITGLMQSNFYGGYFNLFIALNGSKYKYNTNYSSSADVYMDITTSNTYITVTYETVTQAAPSPSYPKDVTLMESQSTLFSWKWNSETEAVQAGVILEYKKSTDADYTVLNLTQTTHSYTLNTQLSPGTYYWRMKGINDISETSDYSEVVTFNVIGKPEPPLIATPENKALTTISWSTAEQYAFEVKLTDANDNELFSGAFASSATSWKPNMFLKGNYSVSVRIKNSSDLWSDWATSSFAIDAAGPSAATVSVIPENTRVRLLFAIPDDATGAIIRISDGKEKILAAGLDANTSEYIDDTVSGGKSYTYVIRTYMAGYTDSAECTVLVNYPGYILNTENNGELHLTSSEEQYLMHEEEIEKEAELMSFSGREFPMTEFGEHTTIRISKKAYVTDDQKKILQKTIREADKIFYRDGRGNAFPAAVTAASYSSYMADGYHVNLTLVRLQESEVVVNV